MSRLEKEFNFENAATAFYDELFKLFPNIKGRFRNVASQTQMFEIALKTVIKNQRDHKELNRYLSKLGEQHKMIGVQRLHMRRGYKAFRQALITGYPAISDVEISELTEIYKSLLATMGYDLGDENLKDLSF